MSKVEAKGQTGIDRVGALSKAIEFAYKSEIDGDYMEFGVWKGTSLIRAMELNRRWQQRTGRRHMDFFIGFDSFEGLPQLTPGDQLKDYGVFYEGQFSDTSVEHVQKLISESGFSLSQTALIPGYYEKSLHDPELLSPIAGRKAAVVHIDCDLYSSALECLNYAGKCFVDGSVLLFDDWFCYRGRKDRGVHKALLEWLEINRNFSVSEYFNYSWAGKAFIVSQN